MRQAETEAHTLPRPERLRPAMPSDVGVGNIIWNRTKDPSTEPVRYWHEIDEVHYPDDLWKAYSSNGDRYGLFDAWVEDLTKE